MNHVITHLTLSEPPEFLFKTVREEFIDKTYKHGLKRERSLFVDTYASEKQSRRGFGKRTVYTFVIMARLMADDGYRFFHAETGEWLIDEVPAKYLRFK